MTEYGDSAHDNNGPWRDYKASIYEGGHRVPFIVRWGDGTRQGSRIAPGSIVDHTIVAHDWVATVYELTGQAMAEDQAMDSASLLPLLTGRNADPPHEFVLYQAGDSQLGAIREGSHVLVVDGDNRATELYDLGSDPAQTANLIDEPGQQARVSRLLETFIRHNDHDNSTFTEPRTAPQFMPAGSN